MTSIWLSPLTYIFVHLAPYISSFGSNGLIRTATLILAAAALPPPKMVLFYFVGDVRPLDFIGDITSDGSVVMVSGD